MKLFALALLAVGAVASKPEIQISGSNLVEATAASYGNNGVTTATHADFAPAGSFSLVVTCDYTTADTSDSCKMPTATAKDTDGTNVAVAVSYYKYSNRYQQISSTNAEESTSSCYSMDPAGNQHGVKYTSTHGSDASCVQTDRTAVHWIQMLKYDATDASGNKANQVVVAFNIQDNVGPEHVETAYGNELTQSTNDIWNSANEPANDLQGHLAPWAVGSVYNSMVMTPTYTPFVTDAVDAFQTSCVLKGNNDDIVNEYSTYNAAKAMPTCYYRFIIATNDGADDAYFMKDTSKIGTSYEQADGTEYFLHIDAIDSSGNYEKWAYKVIEFSNDNNTPIIESTHTNHLRHECNDNDSWTDDNTITCRDWYNGEIIRTGMVLGTPESNADGLTLTSDFDATLYTALHQGTITYTCTNSGANPTASVTITRPVEVYDETPVVMTGDYSTLTVWAGNKEDFQNVLDHNGDNPQGECDDTDYTAWKNANCPGAAADATCVTLGDKTYDNNKAGCYQNQGGHSAWGCENWSSEHLIHTRNGNFVNTLGEAKAGQTHYSDDQCKPLFFDGTHSLNWLLSTIQCTDNCSPTVTKQRVSIKKCEGGNTANCDGGDYVAAQTGTWEFKYECFDILDTDNSAYTSDRYLQPKQFVSVFVTNEDKMKPIINLKGNQPNPAFIAAEAGGEFLDHGAECYDLVDGQINGEIKVSGQVVNKAKPGTYTITYNCADDAGNDAVPFVRTVIVQGRVSPKLQITGDVFIVAEAGFEYHEIGCVGTDDLDNTYTQVNPVPPTGQPANCVPTVRQTTDTVRCAILEIKERAYSRTETSAKGDGADWTCVSSIDTTDHNNVDKEYRIEYFSRSKTATHAVFNFHNPWLTGNNGEAYADRSSDDDCGQGSTNPEETKRQCRTILVRDTLPPVITVTDQNANGLTVVGTHNAGLQNDNTAHLKSLFGHNANNLNAPHLNKPQRHAVNGHTVGGVADNSHHFQDGYGGSISTGEIVAPTLAEDSSVQTGINGWVVGAIASAISGLALLGYAGYSMKKRNGYSSTVMSVPV